MQSNSGISRVAIIGNGMLGVQIALLSRYRGYEVSLFDEMPNIFEETIEKYREDFIAKGLESAIPIKEWNNLRDSCVKCNSLESAVKTADLVIEAVPENLEIKKKVFKQIGMSAPKHAILATNSSSMPVSRIEESSGYPERCLNIHFYQILSGMNMADVMAGTRTLPEVFENGIRWVESLKCMPLKVKKELLGFCFNRVWRAIKKETLYMWGNSFVDFRDVDKAWMIFSGMNFGPFGFMDIVGLDTVHNIEMVYYEESKDPKDIPPVALKQKIERGDLGVKSGKGFYTYPNPEYSKPEFLKT